MDLLLTPLLNRVLRKFIRSSSEGAGSELRVSLSTRGTLTLHNLELCLDSVLEGVGFLSVTRAFARKLQVTVPWTGLTSQPIQVVLDTVELVLGPGDLSASHSLPGPAQHAQPDADAQNGGGGGSSWLGGTLQAFALRAGLNLSIKLNNVVVKYVEPGLYSASLTFSTLHLCTCSDGWRDALQNPEAWLKKECTIKGLSVCLDQCNGVRRAVSFQPVLRAPSIKATAQLPVFAFLEGAPLLGDAFKTSVSVEVEPVELSVNNWQLRWAGMLAALLKEAAAAKAAARAAAEADEAEARALEVAGVEAGAGSVGRKEAGGVSVPMAGPGVAQAGQGHVPPTPVVQVPQENANFGSSPPDRSGLLSPYKQGTRLPATKALGVFGKVWDYVVDEAQYLEAIEESRSPVAAMAPSRPSAGFSGSEFEGDLEGDDSEIAAALPPMHAELDFVVKGLAVHLAVVQSCAEDEAAISSQQQQGQGQQEQGGGVAALAAGLLPLAQPQAQPQQPALRPATTRSEQEQRFMEALQAQLSMQSTQRATARSRPAAEVHQLAVLMVHHVAVNVSSVDASFTSIEVRLESCSLRRNAAAASLPPALFASSHPAAPLPLHPARWASGERAGSWGGSSPSRVASDSLPGGEVPQGALSGLGTGVVHYHRAVWDEVLGLHPLSPEAMSGMAPATSAAAETAAARAVHVRWQNPGAAATASSATGPGAAQQQLQQRCAVQVGQVFACWAPGFATSVVVLVQPVLAAIGGVGGEQQAPTGQQQQEGEEEEGQGISTLVGAASVWPAEQRPLEQALSGNAAGIGAEAGAKPAQGSPSDEKSGGGGSGSSGLAAVLSGLALEAHVGALQLGLLASQAEGSAGAVLSFTQIECRSGPLNWGASWNRGLRESLLAPPSGFSGLGLRASIHALTLAVAQHWEPAKSRAGQLDTFPGCLLATNRPQLQAVVTHGQPSGAGGAMGGAGPGLSSQAAAPALKPGVAREGPALEGNAAGSTSREAVLVSAALSALSLHLTGQQLAAVVAAVNGMTTELGSGFRQPGSSARGSSAEEQLQEAAPDGASGAAAGGTAAGGSADGAAAGQHQGELQAGSEPGSADSTVVTEGWIESLSLELGPLQAAFCQVGALPSHFRLEGAEAAAPALAPTARLVLCCPSAGVALAARSQQAQQQAGLRLLVVRPSLWCAPGLGLSLPSAEVRLASLARFGPLPAAPLAAGSAPPAARAVLTWHEQPALLLAGSSYTSGPTTEPAPATAAGAQVEGQQVTASSGHEPAALAAPAEATAIQLGSLSLAVTPQDYDALVAFLACTSSGPALPPQPAYSPPLPPAAQAAASPDAEASLNAEPADPAPAGAGRRLLAVSLDQVCLSVSTWEGPSSGQQAQRAQHGVAAWASRLRFCRTVLGGPAPSSLQISLGSLCTVLTRQEPGRLLPAMCPVISWPAASLGGGGHDKAALEYTLGPAHPRQGSTTQQQLSARSGPLLLALSPEVFSTLAAIANPLRVSLQPAASSAATGRAAPEKPAPAPPAEPAEPAASGAPAIPLRGAVSIRGLSIRASLSSAWEEAAGATEGAQVAPEAVGSGALSTSATAGPDAGSCAAAELTLDEVAFTVHQTPAAEGRPWLGAEAGVTTSVDASLVAARLTVHHQGPPGAASTTVLPPADGRLQLLKQQPGGCLSVGLHAAALPLRISMPAIRTMYSVISELSRASDALSQPAASSSGGPSAAAPKEGGLAPGSSPGGAQLWQEQRLDDLRWGGFTAVAAEADLGPLQVKAVTTAQKGGLKWALSPQKPQIFEHCIHWTYSQDRPVTVLLIEGCTDALLGTEFQLACAVPAEEEGAEEGDFVELPIRAVALNSPSSPPTSHPSAQAPTAYPPQPRAAHASAPAAGTSGAEAQRSGRHDVAIMVLAPQPSRQWQLLWTSPAAAGPSAHSAAVLQQLHVNPSWWAGTAAKWPGLGAAAEGSSFHAHICSHLGLPHHPVPAPLACPLTIALEAEVGAVSLLAAVPVDALAAPPFNAAAPAIAASGSTQAAWAGPEAGQVLPAGAGLGMGATSAQGQQAQQQQYTWDELARLGMGRLKLAVHSWEGDYSPLTVDAQALVTLHYLDSSIQASTALLEPFQLDACYESQPLAPRAKGAPASLLASQQGSACSSSGGNRARLSSQEQGQPWGGYEGARDGPEEEGEEEEEGQSVPARGGRRRRLPLPPLLPPPFFHAGLPMHDLGCLAARAPPAQPGMSISLQALHQPLVANVSELTVHELQRLVSCLSGSSSSSEEGSSSNSSEEGSSSNSSRALPAAAGGAGSAAAQQAGGSSSSSGGVKALPAPILILNQCGIDLWVSQQGTHQRVLLANGGELAYRWPVPPGFLAGAVRKLLVAAACPEKGTGNAPAAPTEAAWSQPFEAMAQSACQLLLPLPSGITLTVAARASCEGRAWRVLLLPGARVCNHLGQPMHCCIAAPALPGSASHLTQQLVLLPLSPRERRSSSSQPPRPRAVTAPPLSVEPLAVGPGASAPFMLTHWQPPAAQAGSGSGGGAMVEGIFPVAKLWLGALEGWSSEATFRHLAEEVQVLHAAPGGQMGLPFLVAGLDSLPKPGLPSLGAVLCHLQPLDSQTGQTVLSFWPPVILHNRLPHTLFLRLPSWEAAGAKVQPPGPPGARPLLSGGQRGLLELAPGACLPVPVQFSGGELARLSLRKGAAQGQEEGQQGALHPPSSTLSCFSVPLRTPPMVGAGGGPVSPTRALEGEVLIPQPGDCVALEVPSALGLAHSAAPAAQQQQQQQRRQPEGSVGRGGTGAGGLECVLLTEQESEELPLLRLTLLPQGVVRNCLPVPIAFQVPGLGHVSIPPNTSVALDWRQLPSRPREAQISVQAHGMYSMSSAAQQEHGIQQQQQQEHGVVLSSQHFPLDDSVDAHLVLRSSKGLKSSSGRALGMPPQGRQGQGAGGLECRAAAQVVIQKHAGEVETVSITITPGSFVSNLSGLPLLLHREGSALLTVLASYGTSGSSSGSSSSDSSSAAEQQQQQHLEPGCTLPLLNLWGSDPGPTERAAGSAGDTGAGDLAAPLHRRKHSWGGADLLRTFSTGGGMHVQGSGALPPVAIPSHQQQQPSKPRLRFSIAAASTAEAAAVAAIAAPGAAGGADVAAETGTLEAAPGKPPPQQEQQPLQQELAWSSGVDPFRASGRQRLYLQDPATGSAVLVTYRTLLTGGRLHLVLFRDRQPPFTIHNRTPSALELGYFPPRELPDGGFEYTHPRYALRVAAGQRVECDFDPDKGKVGAGLAAGTENELLSPRRGSSSGGGKDGQRGGWEDEEDEDAFLDCLLQEELRARGQARERPPAIIKFRQPGAKEWEHPCVLLPGCHPTDSDTCVDVSRACATTHIVVRPAARPPAAVELEGAASEAGTPLVAGKELRGGAKAAAAAAQAAGGPGSGGELEQPSGAGGAAGAEDGEREEPQRPLRLAIHARQVQLCIWDDDRRRLLPQQQPSASSAGPLLSTQHPLAHPVPGHVVALPAAPSKELFCVTLDGLIVGFSRCILDAAAAARAAAEVHLSGRPQGQSLPSPSGKHSQLQGLGGGSGRASPSQAAALAWQGIEQPPLIEYQVQVLAQGLHCDSFLPGSEYPVVLTTLAQEQHSALSAAQQASGGPGLLPITLQVTVHYAPGPHHRVPSFRNTWIHQLLVHLPTLAVAADDALLAFADHARSVLGAPEPRQPLQAESLTFTDAACGHSYHEGLLQRSLEDEAKGAAASRLYIETAEVEPIQVLADVHLSKGTAGLPVAVDVHRAPVTLSRIAAHSALFRPHVLVRGLMAHGIAEALLNAPGMLGSLELLFNPTGLVQSVRQGVSDLVGLPMAALQARSPTQFLANIGRGSASLVMHLTGWTLSSISGFSTAFSRAVDSAVAIRQQRRAVPLPPSLGRGLVQGLTGLAEGVAAGLSAVVEAPIQGYSSGSGVLSGLGRGLLGAIGLPVSGALELVGAVSAGLASSAGIAHRPEPRRVGRDVHDRAMLLLAATQQQQDAAHEVGGPAGPAGLGSGPHEAGSAGGALSASRLLAQALQSLPGSQLGPYVAHCALLSATVTVGPSMGQAHHGMVPAGGQGHTKEGKNRQLHVPVLLLAGGALVVYESGGLAVAAALPWGAVELQERHSTQEATLSCSGATFMGQLPSSSSGGSSSGCGEARTAGAMVRVSMGRYEWLTVMPQLRRQLRGASGSAGKIL